MKSKKKSALLVTMLLLIVSGIVLSADENPDTEIDVIPLVHETYGEGFFITRAALEEIAHTIESERLYKQEVSNLRNDLVEMTEYADYWQARYERARTLSVIGFTIDTAVDALLAGGLIYLGVTK